MELCHFSRHPETCGWQALYAFSLTTTLTLHIRSAVTLHITAFSHYWYLLNSDYLYDVQTEWFSLIRSYTWSDVLHTLQLFFLILNSTTNLSLVCYNFEYLPFFPFIPVELWIRRNVVCESTINCGSYGASVVGRVNETSYSWEETPFEGVSEDFPCVN